MSTEQEEKEPNDEVMDEVVAEITQPIIVDLGNQKTKKLKQLKQGEGELWDEIFEVMSEVKNMLGEDLEGKLLVPIVMIYEKKRKRRRIDKLLFPLS